MAIPRTAFHWPLPGSKPWFGLLPTPYLKAVTILYEKPLNNASCLLDTALDLLRRGRPLRTPPES